MGKYVEDEFQRDTNYVEDRITREQVGRWMFDAGFALVGEFDLFQGDNNPKGAGMPERWFVVYQRQGAGTLPSR